MISTKPISGVANSVGSRICQAGRQTAKEILRKNPTLEKELVEIAQSAPKGTTPLDVIMKQLKEIGMIKK